MSTDNLEKKIFSKKNKNCSDRDYVSEAALNFYIHIKNTKHYEHWLWTKKQKFYIQEAVHSLLRKNN